jgi:hypothetical protein
MEKITTCNVKNWFDESWIGETQWVKCIIMRLKMKVKVSYRNEVEIVRVLGDEWMNEFGNGTDYTLATVVRDSS